MEYTDTMIWAEAGDNGMAYRFLRQSGEGGAPKKKVLHVWVTGKGAIPDGDDEATLGGPSAVAAELRSLMGPDEWSGSSWTTFTVERGAKGEGPPTWAKDATPAPELPAAVVADPAWPGLPSCSLLGLAAAPSSGAGVRPSSALGRGFREVPLPGVLANVATSSTAAGGTSCSGATTTTCMLKVVSWFDDISNVTNELRTYRHLSHRVAGRAPLAPRLLAYVYEPPAPSAGGSDDGSSSSSSSSSGARVVGFLVEHVRGRPAGIEDLPAVRAALGDLHAHALHGDLRRRDVLIVEGDGEDGGGGGNVRFVGLENSALRADAEAQGWAEQLEAYMAHELDALEDRLLEEL